MICRNIWYTSFFILFTVLQKVQGHESALGVGDSKTLVRGNMGHFFSAAEYEHLVMPARFRRQTVPTLPNFDNDDDSRESKPFIPRIEPPPPGSILTYDGKPISTNVGAFSIVPKTERRTPSISRKPQYSTYRGTLPIGYQDT